MSREANRMILQNWPKADEYKLLVITEDKHREITVDKRLIEEERVELIGDAVLTTIKDMERDND